MILNVLLSVWLVVALFLLGSVLKEGIFDLPLTKSNFGVRVLVVVSILCWPLFFLAIFINFLMEKEKV